MSLFQSFKRCAPLIAITMIASIADAAPIRVATFIGVGQGRYGGIYSRTGATAIESFLAAPESAGLGPELLIPSEGFRTTRFGNLNGYATPTTEERQIFIDALDTVDVVVFIENVEIGNIFGKPDHRDRLKAFSRTKGVISVHRTLDTFGTWPAWDTLQGARFQNFPSNDRLATIRLDIASSRDPAWKFLNLGLPDTARFVENWLSFIQNGSDIRADSNLKVSVNINESSYDGGLGGARAMGADHPLSWYKSFPEGGRFFYTSIGYRTQTFLGTTTGATTPEAVYFLRRQLYNAILWAAGVDSTGNVVSVADRNRALPARFADHARVTFNAGALTVSLLNDGPNTVEVLGVDGRRVALKRSAGRTEQRFDALRSGVYIVSVTTGGQRVTRMAVVE